MSFHDRIALKARLDGNTSAQFRTGAQRHANTTWIYLIVGVGVWYFVSWLWALIPFAFAAYATLQCISATAVATRLEKYEKSRESAL